MRFPDRFRNDASRSRRPRLVLQRLRQGSSWRTACERGGAVIINVDGKDSAVNGMAGPTTLKLSGSGTAPLIQKPT